MAVWLSSKNNSVVEFALKIIETFRVADMYEPVIKSLGHPCTFTQLQAVKTIKSLWQTGSSVTLQTAFDHAATNVQVAILDVLDSVSDENDLVFYCRLLKHPNRSVQVKAAQTIRSISANWKEMLNEEMNTDQVIWSLLPDDAKNLKAA
jgi:hypothetical protein